MDAVLILDGKIPQVDFSSRQPLYSYIISIFLKIFGIHYISGRLLPLTFSLFTSIVIYLMTKCIFNIKIALMASSTYLMMPLEIFNSVIVKTQPFVSLLSCLCMYNIFLFLHSRKKTWIFTAGIFAAMGFYVRQSSIILPLVVLGGFIALYKGKIVEIAKDIGLFLAGYSAVILLVLVFYNRYTEQIDLFAGWVSPLGFLAESVEKLFAHRGSSSGLPPGTLAPQVIVGAWDLYYRYLYRAIHLHAFLLVGFGFSIISFGHYLFIKHKQKISVNIVNIVPYVLLHLWVFFLFIAYAYYFYERGFFIDYFREFLAPLVIILSSWLYYFIPALKKEGVTEKFIFLWLCLSIILFFVQSNYHEIFGVRFFISLSIASFVFFYFIKNSKSSAYLFVSALFLIILVIISMISTHGFLKFYMLEIFLFVMSVGLIYISPWFFLEKKMQPSLENYSKFTTLSVVLGAFVVSVSYSAVLLNRSYDSVWSPQAVEETAAYLQAHTRGDAKVMSGAVIWELQASRRPFQMISHPLRFIGGISAKEQAEIKHGVATNPPEAIILDGYTEKTYFRHLPWLMEFLQAEYRIGATIGPARYPVHVYLRQAQANQGHK